ncbi:MAG: hypothetical protein WB341_01200 [Terracidiphilus sp.]
MTLVLAVRPTATSPKSTVLDDAIRVPVAVLFTTNDPEHPLRARLQYKKKSSQIDPNFKWRMSPPNERGKFIHARTRFIAKANLGNIRMITNVVSIAVPVGDLEYHYTLLLGCF